MLSVEYTNDERKLLLEVARRSIRNGIDNHRALPIRPSDFSTHLRQRRACFVTLRLDGDLRGCTGAIAAREPLVRCIAEHAYSSAFLDTRFSPLEPAELDGLWVSISVLSPTSPIEFFDETDLVSKIHPHRDGLVIEVGRSVGTLLPSVWENLHEPAAFLRQLKRKAGLAADFWSEEIRVLRYTTEEFSDTP
jgi:hypothetical protein